MNETGAAVLALRHRLVLTREGYVPPGSGSTRPGRSSTVDRGRARPDTLDPTPTLEDSPHG